MAFDRDGFGLNYQTKNLFGRTVLKTSLKENELNALTIQRVLLDVLPVHFENRKQIDYLIGYYKGNQDILLKTKNVRKDINNKVLENNAFHIVEFKKGYVFGDPVQYVQRGTEWKDEIEKLNKYMVECEKPAKDKDLAEDMYICGTSYRLIFPNDDVDMPFVIYNSSPKETGVVYSSGYENKPLLAFYIATKKDYTKEDTFYYVITVYTRKSVYTYRVDKRLDEFQIDYIPNKLESQEVNWLGYIPIIEYPLNKSRLGVIELVKSTLDALNKISSNDIDDIEQFVQSLLVLINADIDAEEYQKMLELGAAKFVSNDDRGQKVDVKLLSNKLEHADTKVLYDRLYNNMLTIAGVPKMTDKSSSGDTGQARLVGEGWIMADERAKQDELSFKIGEKELLKIAIAICESKSETGIKKLRTSDIEIKFTRNKSDNILVKTQALLNLKSSQVSPEVAFNVIGLFSDSNEVVNKSVDFFGEDFWKVEEEQTQPNNTVTENGNQT
jgi:SPP1 family phage portal protein